MKHISYLKHKLWAPWKMCVLTAPAVPHPLPSFAPALTGLLSASSLLWPGSAAFPLLPQVHRPVDLEEFEKEIMRTKCYYSIPLRAPALHPLSVRHRDGMHPCLLCSDSSGHTRSQMQQFLTFICLVCLCSYLGLQFLFRCLPHNHRTAELSNSVTQPPQLCP